MAHLCLPFEGSNWMWPCGILIFYCNVSKPWAWKRVYEHCSINEKIICKINKENISKFHLENFSFQMFVKLKK